jgi:hypothetical protein
MTTWAPLTVFPIRHPREAALPMIPLPRERNAVAILAH